ncbi:hypothetical protein [Aquimarina aquimarini]|uniref:hypothetical protein n=1 Tax=Aquimarina aquimarini TaxID=1191734 RepID=UPI000D55AE4C|nr:hypothetical protein [Aquimarina aquimarini]
MKEKIIKFLDKFFDAEVDAFMSRRMPDIDEFNKRLEKMNSFISVSLENRFGLIPQTKLMVDDFYERAQKAPPCKKRFLFRIDEFDTKNGEKLFKCFVSGSNPRLKTVFNLFIIKVIDGELKIITKFSLSDNGMGSGYLWYSGGGDENYEHKVNGESLINPEAFDIKVSEYRILEPENETEEMLIYNQE